jgi:hypothetical protein
MTLDKIKTLLELRRVAIFLDESFGRMKELMDAITTYEKKDAAACQRFRRWAEKPPRHRHPLG